ncbi:MAG: hypothetical protein NTX53_15705 [candidate division WOR-3 bacterium]|nr:hypothetical protein [candidate division WOR-3 bacterium]
MSKQRIGKLVIKSTAEDSAPLDNAIQSLTALRGVGAKGAVRGTGGAVKVRQMDTTLKGLQKAKAALKAISIELDPYMDPKPLAPLYDKKKLEVPAEIQVDSAKFDFYVVPLGANLFVTKGVTVRSLRLNVVLDTKSGEGRRAVAQSIFPTTEYKQYAAVNLTAGLNASLGFDIPLKLNGLPWVKVADIDANIKAGFVFGPFEYSFKRCVVMGAGAGSFDINWAISKGDLLSGGDFDAWLVLKVPKGTKSISCQALMEAELSIPHFPFPRNEKRLTPPMDYDLSLS